MPDADFEFMPLECETFSPEKVQSVALTISFQGLETMLRMGTQLVLPVLLLTKTYY